MDNPTFRKGTFTLVPKDDLEDPTATDIEYELTNKIQEFHKFSLTHQIMDAEPERGSFENHEEYILHLASWLRDQQALADIESKSKRNPVNSRWDKENARIRQLIEYISEIIDRGEFDHIELADLVYDSLEEDENKEKEFSRNRLIKAMREHLYSIGRKDLIRGLS